MSDKNQQALNSVCAELVAVVEQFANGLITVTEVIDFAVALKPKADSISLSGLLCPVTGLRYPNNDEIKAIDDGLDFDFDSSTTVGPSSDAELQAWIDEIPEEF